ncbi:hypothetical protein HDV06_003079 [Boothiomyces sp. JEL0866]|nr:hypothetical protein HDV06_000523 [Boothiomyces sp. JEL0866]KAJ3322359.1 hypothetical protein HDV06_003079 [Boothiomyces sp. JEL0866]
MPPKKAKKSKAAPEVADAAELALQESYAKCLVEKESLQQELEHKNEVNARLRQTIQDQKLRIEHLESILEMRTQDRLDLTSDMSRQYKTMQSELISEVNRLETASFELHTKLEMIQTAFTEARKNHAEELAAKEAQLEEQNLKMAYMTAEFENMLKVF